MTTLQAFKCKDCNFQFSVYVKDNNTENVLCEKCFSKNLQKTYLPIDIKNNELDNKVVIGEEVSKVIEENKFILNKMKEEKM